MTLDGMILVFDLDDTLYPEITYVYSGFRAVSRFLSTELGISPTGLEDMMKDILEQEGRGKVFNVVLEKYGLSSKRNISNCLKTYRFHKPDIQLYDDAREVLEKLRLRKKYLVTDGNKIVQQNKIEALKLRPLFNKIFITHRYGIAKAKPDPYCFLQICKLEKAQPENVVYIGDNPNKDFVGIKKLGFKTIRVKRGMFKDILMPVEYEADFCVNSLLDISF